MNRLHGGVALLATMALLGACADGTAPAASPDAEFVAAVIDPEAQLLGGTRAADGASPCTYQAATGQFTCPARSAGGLTMTRSYAWYDAAGAAMAAPQRGVTASSATWITVAGTVTRPDGSTMTVDRAGQMRVDGLLDPAGPRTLNGAEHGTTVASMRGRDGQAVEARTTIADSTRDVVMPPASTRPAFPQSGVRVHVMTRQLGSGAGITTRRVETYLGGGKVQVELTTPAGTRTCTVDLGDRRTRPAC
jgi:hypothetical protein